MATMTADELKQRLARAGFVYDPSPTTTRVDEYGGFRYAPDETGAIREVTEPKFLFRHLLSGEHFTTDEIVPYVQIEQQSLEGKPRAELVRAIENIASQTAATPFGPNTINVTKAQEAQILNQTIEMQRAYDASRNRGGFGGFLGDLVGGINEVVTAVTDPIANALGVHPDVVKVAAAALGMYYAPGVGFTDAAGAAVSDAAAAEMIAAYGADALTAAGQMEAAATLSAAAPAATVASPVATSPLAPMGGPNVLMDFPANMIDTSLGQSYNALGVGAGVPAAAGAVGATNALSAADLAALDAGLGGVPSTATGSNALATGAGAFDAASALETQLAATGTGAGAAASGAGAAATFDPASALETQIAASDAAALANAGFNLSDIAKFAKDYGVPLSALISGITGSRAATNAAEI